MRWLILDLAEASTSPTRCSTASCRSPRALRARRGELIVAGAPSVAQRLGTYDVAHRPAVAANVDQAVMILKMLRPKTDIRRPPQRAKQRISSLTLPRIEPSPSSRLP